MTLVRPMLAKTFGDGPSCQYREGMIVQPKLNGVRAMYCNGVFVSRGRIAGEPGEVWSDKCLQHLRSELAPFRNVVLDGELYIHGQSLQEINSKIAVVRTEPHPEEASVEFHVFDYVSREFCINRLRNLVEAISSYPDCKVKRVRSYLTRSELEANSYYKEFKLAGYEGMMYRDPHMPYALPENCSRKDLRCHWLLKRKDWLDLDATIIGLVRGKEEGKYRDTLGCFLLDWNGIQFEASSGLSDYERDFYYRLGPKMVGQKCKLEYRELTKDGTPFHCRIIEVELPKGFDLSD